MPDHDAISADVRGFLAAIDRDDLDGNSRALMSLDRYVTKRKEIGRKSAIPNGVTDDTAIWKMSVEHLVNRAKQLEPRDGEAKALKVREDIVGILARDAGEPYGRNYLMHVLDAGPNNLRMVIIWAMRGKNGLHGDDASGKVKKLCDDGILPENVRGMALASAGPELLDATLNYLATTQDRMGFINAALAYELKNRSSEHFDLLLRRVKELRLDQPVDKYRDGVFWIDRKLLARFIDKASGVDLKNGLEVMGMNSGLIGVESSELQPVLKCLSNSDAEIRRLAARRLAELDSIRADQELIVNSLAAARRRESDSVTMGVIDQALSMATQRRDRQRKETERSSKSH